ncbi:hypothetical protein [uncultured Muribaculum sp.]|uniref:hypothetical protein n=1 Tax=uncultured Muribaculum sp. TaxID=1918613 RepID=UPI00266FD691|nr:hypothetical protein [uncultured Muribaculum sp.]
MKKYFLPLIAMLCAGAVFTSCDDDDYSAGPESDGAYFATNTANKFVNLFRDETVIEIPVLRNSDGEAASFGLTLTDPSGMFSVPEAVTFSQGQKETLVPITFDGEALALTDYKVELSINGNAYPYGITTLSLTIGLDGSLRWARLGTGKYTDGFLTSLFGMEPVVQDVEIDYNLGTKGLYRIVNPYGDGTPYVEEGEVDPNDIRYMEIDASNPKNVVIEPFNSGLDWGYGEMTFMSASYYYMDLGNSAEAIIANKLNGTLVNNVITFNSGALFVQMDKLYKANTNEAFRLELPVSE